MLALLPSSFAQSSEPFEPAPRFSLTTGKLDIQLVQHFGLTNRSTFDFVNRGLPSSSFSELRGVYNLNLTKSNYGLFADFGIGLFSPSAMKSLDLNSLPTPNSGASYFVRGNVSESGSSSASLSMKLAVGAYKRFVLNDLLSFSPYVGIGLMTTSQRQYKLLLKESGSNNQYDAVYTWNCGDIDQEDFPPNQFFLTGRIKMSYKLSPKSSLILGMEYSQFLNAMDYRQKFTNSFNANVWTNQTIKGNKINTFGLSLGIEFL